MLVLLQKQNTVLLIFPVQPGILPPLIFVFSAQTETCAEVNLQVPRVLGFFRQVLLRKDMDKDSALLLNAGAHYVKVFMSSFNFRSSLLLMTMMMIL